MAGRRERKGAGEWVKTIEKHQKNAQRVGSRVPPQGALPAVFSKTKLLSSVFAF
jgi:hypothetical protein